MEMGDCMEEMKMISNVGYEIGKKAKLHDFEILRLFEFIKYDKYTNSKNFLSADI